MSGACVGGGDLASRRDLRDWCGTQVVQFDLKTFCCRYDELLLYGGRTFVEMRKYKLSSNISPVQSRRFSVIQQML
ncbi:hypothetical protein PILCRDRAFT_824130 [Piloderma croceum F 1598]|uniref:Uncharacterized protein n=1 Tax=Piloderma croceum (strain F 1598) TaxID=765440 RepID=A0A0C3F1Q7_PILCF|nr:hypothetical protein PILCRDRAFT_824130 [Piloderma croceum F 1598]